MSAFGEVAFCPACVPIITELRQPVAAAPASHPINIDLLFLETSIEASFSVNSILQLSETAANPLSTRSVKPCILNFVIVCVSETPVGMLIETKLFAVSILVSIERALVRPVKSKS